MLPEKYMECFRLLLEQLAWIEDEFLSGRRESRKAGSLWGMIRGVGGVRKSIHQSWLPTGQTVNKEYYVEVLREFTKRFLGKKPALFKSGQWHFHQDNAPVHNSILVTDYLSKMGIKTVPHRPYSPDLASCDFWLFPEAEGKPLWDNWGDERGCDECHWHAHTRGRPWCLPEVVTVQQVHCNRRRLLWRGLLVYMIFYLCSYSDLFFCLWK